MAYLKKLEADLASCAEAGILTPDQARKAAEHIAQTQAAGRWKGVTWIAIFAGLMVSVGIVLIVSHNWDKIPGEAKMLAFMLWLAGIGAAAIKTRDQAPSLNIPLELLWFFMPVVGIGLYAQIFQLSGDPIKPYLIWLALTAPIAWLSKSHATPTVYVAALLAVLFYGTHSSGSMLSMTRNPAPLAPLLASLILATGASLSHFKLKPEHRVAVVGAGLGWIFSMLMARSPVHIKQAPLILAAGLALSTLWLCFTALLSGEEDHRSRPRWFWLAAVYLGTYLWHSNRPGSYQYYGSDTDTMAGMWLTGLLTAAAVAAALFTPSEALSRDKSRALLATGMLAFTAILPYFGLWTEPGLGLVMNLVLAVAALGLMWNGSLEGRAGQINAGVASLFLLILTRFIDVFGSLLDSGIAFIGSGVLLGMLAYGLNKGRESLLEKARSAQ